MYVCLCKAVTDKQLLDAIDDGTADFNELQEQLGVATNCGACREYAQELINERLAAQLGFNAA